MWGKLVIFIWQTLACVNIPWCEFIRYLIYWFYRKQLKGLIGKSINQCLIDRVFFIHQLQINESPEKSRSTKISENKWIVYRIKIMPFPKCLQCLCIINQKGKLEHLVLETLLYQTSDDNIHKRDDLQDCTYTCTSQYSFTTCSLLQVHKI